MTRAEDVLIMTGCLAQATKDVDKALEGSWYGAAREALADNAATLFDPILGEEVMRFPLDAPQPAPVVRGTEQTRDADAPFTLQPLVPSKPMEIVSPSGLGATGAGDEGFAPDAERLLDAATARDRGIALHALLQHLTGVPRERRAEVSRVAASTLLPEAPELVEPVAEEALALLDDPTLAKIFGPDARAEVSFALDATRNGVPIRLAGRIDRLVADDEGITIVDFKSDAAAPTDVDGVPEAYLVQLGLYAKIAAKLFPGRKVTTGILWTTPRRLMVLDPSRLAQASAAIALV